MAKNQYKKEPLKNNVEEMFIGPFGSSLKNECFVDEEDAYCMVYEQKHAIQKTLDGKNRFVDKNKYYELKRFTIKPGDIIVSCRGTIGETFIVPENAPLGIMHPSIMKIRLKPNVYNIEYFNLLLKNRLKDYNKSANGSGIKMAISATELGKELFPIPPMDEQQKTSKIFLMVNHLILLRKQQLAKLDELVKARFVEMFGKASLLAQNQTKRLEECCISISGGNTPSMQHPEYYGGNIPFVKSGDVKGDYIVESTLTLTKTALTETTAKILPKSTLIVVIRSAALLKEFRIGMLMVDAVINQDLKALQVSEDFLPVYLMWAIKMQHQVLLNKVQTMLTSHIRMEDLLNLKIGTPPLSLQNQFAAFVERVDQQKQTVQQSLEKLELMKKALMQEYFG